MKRFSNKQIARLFFLFALLFLLLPSSLRALTGNVYLIGDESYYHARMARQIIQEGVPETDDYVFNGRQYFVNPYHLLLAAFALPFGSVTAAKIVPLLLGLLCVYLFYLILSRLRVGMWKKWAALSLLVLSPVFIYTFNVSSPDCLILVLNLTGLFFLMKRGTASTVLSLACFSMVAMFGLLHAMVSAFIVFFFSFHYTKQLKRGYLILFGVLFVIIMYTLPVYLYAENVSFLSRNLIASFVSDLGSSAGFSIFALLLALVGYVLVWKFKKKYYLLYAFSIFLLVYSFFDNSLFIYADIIIVFLAGCALVHFARMNWSLKVLKKFTLLVLFCGLLFSAVNAAVDLRDAQPNVALSNSLIWLELNSDSGETVFSHYSNGFWIEFLSERPVVMDGLLSLTPDVNKLYSDSETIFAANDLDVARTILSKYNVRYIVITNNFYDGFVWNKREQGLDFLLTNAETFKKIQENSYVRIYEYVYPGT